MQGLQVTDRVGALGRMVAGIGAVRVLREVPGVPPLEIEQVGIALAGDEDRGTGGDDLPGDLLDPGDEPQVSGTRAMPMGRHSMPHLRSKRSRLDVSNS